MNFVVTIAFGLIIGGLTIWRMGRATENGHDEGDLDSSEGVSIETVNEVDAEMDESLLAANALDESERTEDIQVVKIESGSALSETADELEESLDKLQQITGIGPTYSRRIYEAGIESVEELAKLTAEKLQEIVTPGRTNPTAETEKWLDQARQLAAA